MNGKSLADNVLDVSEVDDDEEEKGGKVVKEEEEEGGKVVKEEEEEGGKIVEGKGRKKREGAFDKKLESALMLLQQLLKGKESNEETSSDSGTEESADRENEGAGNDETKEGNSVTSENRNWEMLARC